MKVAEPPVEVQELHHGSHNALLADVSLDDESPAQLDAIIVPTAWPTAALRHVFTVGRDIGTTVVALCSKQATARQACDLADELGTRALAVDVDQSLAAVLPSFSTDRLLRPRGLCTTSDLSIKRNLGLTLARGSSWERVLFLDDDILIDEPDQLRLAAGLLDRYRAVGLRNHGFDDNSVVCHAFRAVGGDQDTFIGGGAMMVNPAETSSFFPNIYNEDWFFLLGDGVPFRAARAGAMKQRPYDPFANPGRAAGEELGDTLAEGLFWLLDFGLDPEETPDGFWGEAVFRRRQFIEYVLGHAPARLRPSLTAARGRSAIVTHRLCSDFVHAWRADLRKWQDFLGWVPVSSNPDKFLWEVGMQNNVLRSQAYLGRVLAH